MQWFNPFTAHPQRQGITYCEHWSFAMGIAARLFISVLAFALHALLPCIPIAPRWDLEATAAYLGRCNRWIEAEEKVNRRESRSALVQATAS